MLSAYRQLLRLGHRAVGGQYPQTVIVQNYIRARFRAPGPPPAPQTLANTVAFMEAAANWTGLERRCVATMVHVEHGKYERHKKDHGHKRKPAIDRVVQVNLGAYDDLLRGLNHTMDLCL